MRAEEDEAGGVVAEGRYRLERLLGRGGMGEVHAALDLHTGRRVALKRLMVTASDKHRERVMELFHHEYRTLSELDHPNVVEVFEYGVDALGPYYTMELLEGQSLHALSPQPYREACAQIRGICAALSVLHARRLLHRDVSPRNVVVTAGGQTKLIDFGTMAQMGEPRVLIGTPPMVAPEAFYQQPVDGRSDLYAVGASLYFVLTGRHAFGARVLGDLPEYWRIRPPPPSAFHEAPPELDALVLGLLSQDPQARPRSAVDVIERLTAIAGLPHDEVRSDRNAYLTTPSLVGRGPQLDALREHVACMSQSDGSVLLIEGEPGLGRSRMLDTLVLEAQLAGATIARASASTADLEPYGMLGRLLGQLPDVHDPLLREVVAGAIDAARDQRERRLIQHALRRYLRRREGSLVLAIDDFARCDEPSQAALARTTRSVRRRRLMLALTCEPPLSGARSAALEVVRQVGVPIALARLSRFEIEALLESVFGDVQHLSVAAGFIGSRAEGSPRAVMELAQHLVDSAVVRYADGHFILPRRFNEHALPESVAAARRAKLEALPPDARALVDALAWADGTGLGLDTLSELLGCEDHDRARAALDVLQVAGLARIDGAQVVLEPRVLAEMVRQHMPAEPKRRACSRVADALARSRRDRLEVARMQWHAGREAEMIQLLLTELGTRSRWDSGFSQYTAMLRDAADACTRLGRPPRERIVLLHELCRAAIDGSLDPTFAVVELFERLALDSGLRCYEGLSCELDAMTRLQQAVDDALKRHAETDEALRGLDPIQSITLLARTIASSCGMAVATGNRPLLDRIPSLEPFLPLSPAIRNVHGFLVPAAFAVVAGRYEDASACYRKYLDATPTPTDSGLDPEEHATVRCALRLALGAIEGTQGRAEALASALELDRAPTFRAAAWGLRQIYACALGNLREARRAARRLDRVLLESAVQPPYSVGTIIPRSMIHANADDLTGLREVAELADAYASVFQTFLPHALLVRAEQARVRGEHAEALAIQEEILSTIDVAERAIWPSTVGSKVTCLTALGRTDEALLFGRLQLERGRAAGLQTSLDSIELAVALAEARVQQYPSACERLERMIARSARLGSQGVLLGRLYEARARVAIWMGDENAFRDCALRCAQQYKKSEGDPALVAKYEQLVRDAAVAGTAARGVRETLTASGSLEPTSVGESEMSTTQLVDDVAIDRSRVR